MYAHIHSSDIIIKEMGGKLSCKKEELRVFLREETPKRLHYSNNKRVGALVLDLDPGYVVGGPATNRPPSLGQHGQDYLHQQMTVSRFSLDTDLCVSL